MTLKKFLLLSLIVTSFFVSTPALAATEIIARSGQVTPIGPGSSYGRFYFSAASPFLPLLSASGRVCFFGNVLGLGELVTGAFCERQYGSQVVWRTGLLNNQAPGTPPGVRFSTMALQQMNQAGEYMFKASLIGHGVTNGNSVGAWISGSQGTELLIRQEGTIPGIPGATFTWFDDSFEPSLTAHGVPTSPVMIKGTVIGTNGGGGSILLGNSNFFTETIQANAVLVGQSDQSILVTGHDILGARRGPAVYGFNLLYNGASAPPPVVVNGISVQTNTALVSTLPNGDLHLVGRSGITQVPDMADGVRYWGLFGGSRRNDSNAQGDFAFSTTMVGPGIAGGNSWAIFLSQNGVTRKVTRENDLITPIPGARYGGFGLSSGASFVKLTDDDAVIFTNFFGLSSVYSNGIFYTKDGATHVVARNGVEMPGLPAGTYFENVSGQTFGLGAKVGSMGDVALAAKLRGTGVTSANDIVVTLWNPDAPTSGLHLVAREGDLIESRYQVTTISNTGADLKINSTGQTVFTATVFDTQTQTSKTALIAGQYGQPTKILAATGETVDGITAPLTALYLRPTLTFDAGTDSFNDNGEVVFIAVMTADSDEAVVLMDVDDFLGGSNSCEADFDQNGTVEVSDIFAYLSAWFAQNISADTNGNGTVAVDDIFAFLSAWFEGC